MGISIRPTPGTATVTAGPLRPLGIDQQGITDTAVSGSLADKIRLDAFLLQHPDLADAIRGDVARRTAPGTLHTAANLFASNLIAPLSSEAADKATDADLAAYELGGQHAADHANLFGAAAGLGAATGAEAGGRALRPLLAPALEGLAATGRVAPESASALARRVTLPPGVETEPGVSVSRAPRASITRSALNRTGEAAQLLGTVPEIGPNHSLEGARSGAVNHLSAAQDMGLAPKVRDYAVRRSAELAPVPEGMQLRAGAVDPKLAGGIVAAGGAAAAVPALSHALATRGDGATAANATPDASPGAPKVFDTLPDSAQQRILANVQTLHAANAPDEEITKYLTEGEGLAPVARGASAQTSGHGDPLSTAGGLLSGVGQGATFGFADEILGGLDAANSVLPTAVGGKGASVSELGQNYRATRDRIRGADADFAAGHPVSHTVAELAGGILPIVGSGGMAGPGAEATTGARLANAARQGATYGAATGAGNANELSDVPGAVASGGVGGAVAGPLVDLGLHGAGSLARALGIPQAISEGATTLADQLPSGRVAGLLRTLGASTGQAGGANAEIARRIASEGETPSIVADRIATQTTASGGKPEILADYSPEVRSLTKAVTKAPGPGRAAVVKALADRNTGVGTRLVRDVANEGGTAAGSPELETLIRARDASAAKLFPDAYASGKPVDDPAIADFLQRPTFKRVYEMAQTMAKDEGRALPTKTVSTLNQTAQALLDGAQAGDRAALQAKFAQNPAFLNTRTVPVPDVQTMAYVDRALRRIIDDGFQGKSPIVDPGHAQALQSAFGELRDRFTQQYPKYGAALTDYAERSGQIDALKTGLNLFNYARPTSGRVASGALGKGDPMALAAARKGITGLEQAVQNMTPTEVTLFRRGAQQAIANAANAVPATLDNSSAAVLRRVFSNTPESTRWQRLIFDAPEQFAMFQNALGRERTMAATSAKMGGSDTKENIAEDAALGGSKSLLSALAHPVQTVRGLADQGQAAQLRGKYAELGTRLSATGQQGMTNVLTELEDATHGRTVLSNAGTLLRNLLVPQTPLVPGAP